jgi:hypothetical protein
VTHILAPDAHRTFRDTLLALLACADDGVADDARYVLLNGDVLGRTPDPVGFAARVRALPPPGAVPYAATSVHVSACDHTVYVHTDEGRVVRPLLVVGGGAEWRRPPFAPGEVDAMLAAGVLRFVDAAELATRDVALDPTTLRARREAVDLMEVHAHLILGVTAALIPFLQNNQSPRNAYQTSMGQAAAGPFPPVKYMLFQLLPAVGRQAVGAPLPPGPFELSPALCYAQRPLCPATVPAGSLADTECGLPMGQNFVIAVLPRPQSDQLLPGPTLWWLQPTRSASRRNATGTGQQNDSIVLNRQSIERGLGLTLFYHTRPGYN